MDVVPIPDSGTVAYRWTYTLGDTPVSRDALRRTYTEYCGDEPDMLVAVNMGEIERQLRIDAQETYGYDWDFYFDTCHTPDPQRDPSVILLQLKKIASRIPGFNHWRGIEIPAGADASPGENGPSP